MLHVGDDIFNGELVVVDISPDGHVIQATTKGLGYLRYNPVIFTFPIDATVEYIADFLKR